MNQSGNHSRRLPGRVSLPSGTRVLTIGRLREPFIHKAANENAPPLRWRAKRARRWLVGKLPDGWPWLALGAGGTALLLAFG